MGSSMIIGTLTESEIGNSYVNFAYHSKRIGVFLRLLT